MAIEEGSHVDRGAIAFEKIHGPHRPHEAEAVEAFVERMGISEAEFLRACVYAGVRGELDFAAYLPPRGPAELVR